MKILYLLSDPARAGLHRQTGYMTHVREVVRALQRAGHAVTLYDTRAERGRDGTHEDSEGAGGVAVSRLPPRLRAVGRDLLYGWRSRALERALERRFAGEDFDLLYERFHHFQEAGGLWAARRGLPHFLEFNAGQDEVAAFHGTGLAGWARRAEDRVVRRATRVFVVSGVLRDRLVARGHDPRRITVLHNAADPERFRPELDGSSWRRRLGIAETELVVGFVGSFASWHGVGRLVDAAVDPLLQSLPLRFLLVGGTPGSSAVRALEARIRQVRQESRVLLAGRIPHESIPDLMAAIDIAVMPWTNEYGSPLKLFEYMAMGKAILAPDRPVIREILKPEEQALLVGESAGALADAIRRLAVEPELRRRLAASVRQRVEMEHNWDHHARVIEQAWQDLQGRAESGGGAGRRA